MIGFSSVKSNKKNNDRGYFWVPGINYSTTNTLARKTHFKGKRLTNIIIIVSDPVMYIGFLFRYRFIIFSQLYQ